VAAVLGNTLNYSIGRAIGPAAFSGRYRFLKQEYLRRTEEFFLRYGAMAVFLSRFMPIIRTFAPFVAGVGRMPAARLSPYERMRIWHESVAPTDRAALVFDAAEAGEPNLGYIIESRLVQAALLDAALTAGVHIEAGEFVALRMADDAAHIETSSGALAARLVIGADGARSRVREASSSRIRSLNSGARPKASRWPTKCSRRILPASGRPTNTQADGRRNHSTSSTFATIWNRFNGTSSLQRPRFRKKSRAQPARSTWRPISS